MVIITSTINSHVYVEILDNFLIPSIENGFGEEAIFQDDNASCHRAKEIKAFLQESHITSMTWPVNSPDVNKLKIYGWNS